MQQESSLSTIIVSSSFFSSFLVICFCSSRIARRFLDSARMLDKQAQFDSQSVFHIRKILNSNDFRRSCRCTIEA